MADKVIDIPGVGAIAFPDSMSDSDMNAAAANLYGSQSADPSVAPVAPLLGLAVPMAKGAVKIAQEAATNPAVPKLFALSGRMVGAVAPVVAGAAKGGPVGAAIGLAASSKGAWAGGKTGWFSGKLLQSTALPVANAAEKIAPYAQALTTLGGVQSFLDLAQMADPNRKDIGTLGASFGDHRSATEKAAHPAMLNALADAFANAIAKAPDAWSRIVSEIKQHVEGPK